MTTPRNDCQERIAQAQRLLEDRLDEDVPLEELARAAHYSMFHFHRLFRALLGETVREHVRRLRLERAAAQLTRAQDDILRIALDAGYESHEAFTRAFKTRFGETPSTFRQQRREVHAQRVTLFMEKEHPMEIHIQRRQPARIAYVRHVGPYNQVGDAWATLMKWGWSKMIFGAPETFGLCYDDPDVTPAERVRYDACMVISAKTKPKGDIQTRDLPGGVFAVTLHAGPYDGLSDTYAELCTRVASEPIDGQIWQLADAPSLEKYLNDPRKTKPADLRTEVWLPVQE